MGYAVGAVLGVAAGVACVWAVGGVAGIACGLAVAALLYLGVGWLLRPEARLGGVVASMLPNGEAALARVEQARSLVAELDRRGADVADAGVAREVRQLSGDVGALVSLVEDQPGAYRRLAHFLTTYSEQCVRLLDGYLSVERHGTPDMRARAAADALEALAALQGAAQGELARASGARAAEVGAASDAITRLMEMDGYRPDARDEAAPAQGEDDAS